MIVMLRKISVLLVIMIALASCDKEHLFDCLKSSGSIIKENRTSSDFQRIDVFNNADVLITQDTSCFIEAEAGEHIIGGITTAVSDGILTVRNENKCNWVRSYAKTITVHVHVRNLEVIHHHGSGEIISLNSITSTRIDLNVWSSGNINMQLNTDSCFLRQHTTVGDLTVSGYSGYCYTYNNGNGFLYGKNFTAESADVMHSGTGDIYLQVVQSLYAQIHDSGNLYYGGHPHVTSSITGSGTIIPF